MGKYAYLQGSGSTPQVGARMSSYAWLGVVLAVRVRIGRVDHPAPHPTSQHGTLGDLWLVATMATMATLGADLLKKTSPRKFSWVFITPSSQSSCRRSVWVQAGRRDAARCCSGLAHAVCGAHYSSPSAIAKPPSASAIPSATPSATPSASSATGI